LSSRPPSTSSTPSWTAIVSYLKLLRGRILNQTPGSFTTHFQLAPTCWAKTSIIVKQSSCPSHSKLAHSPMNKNTKSSYLSCSKLTSGSFISHSEMEFGPKTREVAPRVQFPLTEVEKGSVRLTSSMR
jgi:hypothetical protein